ncbi:MAG: hypothetical protein DMF91_11020 [Acidobacteria bacterium]|nr:MAG: hypothetical protein DMF91_11020 [Acidobacteriota bacterium]
MAGDVTRRRLLGSILTAAGLAHPFARRLAAASASVAFGAAPELQPLVAQVRRLVDAMAYLGEPFADAERGQLDAAANMAGEPRGVEAIQKVLDPRCLLIVRINPESRISIERGAAAADLVEHGWRAFLIKVRNEAGATGALNAESPQARPVYRPGTGLAMAPQSVRPADIAERWLAIDSTARKPLEPQLSGLELEYRVVLLYSRDRGRREAQMGAMLGSGTDDVGFRNRTAILFDIAPSHDVTCHVRDEHGQPATSSFVIRDTVDRVYPARSKRLAPDFFFQNQIYRADGETVRLPAGAFTVTCGRGPEYIPETRAVTIDRDAPSRSLDFRLRRWIDPAALGWYSGDHHVHAAGCSHYESPTEGVKPEDMMRHVLGEGLSVASVLNWGPSYYHQRQFFEGKENKLSTPSTLLRYDLEVSGFPSSHCGHLVLLRLRDQDYPDCRQIEDWPSWDLPILKWAKAQNAITGFAHSGLGLQVKSHELPNFEMPRFDSIGANEYIVDVTHDAVDFISTADTPFVYELNIWYQTLNCGFRTRVSGETDFPCLTDERVGSGRSYVHVPAGLTYDAWCEGVRDGRSYVSDGFSHLMDFSVNGLEAGTRRSELQLERPATVRVTARAASLLSETRKEGGTPDPDSRPFWTPEHARVAGSRDVTVAVVVNGRAVASRTIAADGTLRDLTFDIPIERSSWVALRILGSAHTNPIFILVGGRPIRASKESAEWCVKAVDQCWSQKSPRMRRVEIDSAQRAYDHARTRYRQLVSESQV